MPICSYLVLPEAGCRSGVAATLSALPGCEVEPAENKDLLLLVTDTSTPEEDRRLMAQVEAIPGVQAMVLCFGEVDPETNERDPLKDRSPSKGRRRNLPTLTALDS